MGNLQELLVKEIRGKYDSFKEFEIVGYDDVDFIHKSVRPGTSSRFLIVDLENETIEYQAFLSKYFGEDSQFVYNKIHQLKWDEIIPNGLVLPERDFIDVSPSTKPYKNCYKLGKYNNETDIVDYICDLECDYDIASLHIEDKRVDKTLRDELVRYTELNIDLGITNNLVLYRNDIGDPMEYLYLYEVFPRKNSSDSFKTRSIKFGAERVGLTERQLRNYHHQEVGAYNYRVIDVTKGKLIIDLRGDKVREKAYS